MGQPLVLFLRKKTTIPYSLCPICRLIICAQLCQEMQKENHSKTESGLRPKASTLDILGGVNRKRKINPAWREYYDRLRELREQIMDSRRTLASDAKEERSTCSVHMAD